MTDEREAGERLAEAAEEARSWIALGTRKGKCSSCAPLACCPECGTEAQIASLTAAIKSYRAACKEGE